MALCVTRVAISRGEKLRDGRFHGKSCAGVLFPRRFAHQKTRGVNFRGHVREHELNGLKIGDGMAEGLALLRVGKRRFKGSLRDAGGLRGNADAPAIERGKRDFVSFAFGSDAICDGHFAVREGKFAASGGVDAKFFFFLADGETRVCPFRRSAR